MLFLSMFIDHLHPKMPVYKVVAINKKGKVVEVIKVYYSYEYALAKLKNMNRVYYHNIQGDTFAIIAE